MAKLKDGVSGFCGGQNLAAPDTGEIMLFIYYFSEFFPPEETPPEASEQKCIT